MFLSKLLSPRRDRKTTAEALSFYRTSEQLREILDRERARADRSGPGFAVLKFTPRDAATSEHTLAALAQILKRRLRCTDDAGWLGPQQVGVLLPCTSADGARSVAHDVCQSFAEMTPPHWEVYCYPSDSLGGGDSTGDRPKAHVETAATAAALEPLFVQPMTLAKRTLDIIGAIVALTLAAPIMLTAAAAIKITSPGPIFYRQKRAGKGGQPFWMYKFRTMLVNADALKAQLMAQNEMDGPAFKIKHDPRITPIGRFLRRSSIDELPQLWHVLTGEMSLVGPRAMAWHEAEDCAFWQRRRLDVTPGVTGIWQVYGRARVTFNEWMRMDLQYVDSQSMGTDLKVLAATVPAVLFGNGAY